MFLINVFAYGNCDILVKSMSTLANEKILMFNDSQKATKVTIQNISNYKICRFPCLL